MLFIANKDINLTQILTSHIIRIFYEHISSQKETCFHIFNKNFVCKFIVQESNFCVDQFWPWAVVTAPILSPNIS